MEYGNISKAESCRESNTWHNQTGYKQTTSLTQSMHIKYLYVKMNGEHSKMFSTTFTALKTSMRHSTVGQHCKI